MARTVAPFQVLSPVFFFLRSGEPSHVYQHCTFNATSASVVNRLVQQVSLVATEHSHMVAVENRSGYRLH